MKKHKLVCLHRPRESSPMCGMAARYVVWGRLFDEGERGPRCRWHLPKMMNGRANVDGWAIVDLATTTHGEAS